MGRGSRAAEQHGTVLMFLLIVALLLVDVTVIAARRSRNRFIWEDDSFRCRFRACGTASIVWPGLVRRCTRRWSRPMWARWVDDVLVVRRGPFLPRTLSVRAQMCRAGVYDMPPEEPGGLGSHPIATGLLLNDGSYMEVATGRSERLALVGPYLAAAASSTRPMSFYDKDFNVQARQPNDHEEGWH
jgi:hypothetical protein